LPEFKPDALSGNLMYRNPWVPFFIWVAVTYLPALFSFMVFLPPQGIGTSLRWHALFLLPSLLVAAIGTVVLRKSSAGRFGGAVLGGAIGFLTSLAVSFAGCKILAPRGESEAWYGMPFLSLVFFATLSGTIFGAFRVFSKRA
jgi:hypothetical protein